MELENEISGDIVDAAIKLHQRLGPGLLESAYEMILAAELSRRGHKVERQVPVSFEYDGMKRNGNGIIPARTKVRWISTKK